MVYGRFLCWIGGVVCALGLRAQQETCLQYIDTRVGTAASATQTAGMFGKGTEEYAHTLPAVLEPNGMNFWTPETAGATEKKGVCPYRYEQERMTGFRCSHWIVGGCTQDYGSFSVMPQCLVSKDGNLLGGSRFSHSSEIATPAYYSVYLDDSQTKVEMTGRSRSAMFRVTYADPDSAYWVVTVNSDEGEGEIGIDYERKLIWGKNPVHRIYQGWGERAGFSGWFVMKCDAEIERSGRIDQQRIWVKFKRVEKSVLVKAASSFTSVNGALINMESEMPHWDFEKTRTELEEIWEKKLTTVEVQADDKDALANFYTALYHASFLPHIINDADGSYPQFADGKTIRNDNTLVDFGLQLSMFDYYDDFSMWDTYRALHPLLTILEPQKSGEMMQSLVMKYWQGGWMPIFPCWNSYTAAMIGDHCAAAIADAYVKGIRNFDVVKAYEGLRKNAFESPATEEEYRNGMGRRALASYVQYGYIPLEDSVKEAFHQQEQVSRTLEYAYDDYALAQLARKMIDNPLLKGIDRAAMEKDYRALMRRSQNWKNIIDPATGYANGRHADGAFLVPADTQYLKEPEKHPDAHALTETTFATFITEGTPCHYTWYVPHDISNLIKAMGGKKAFEAKLDSMFEKGYYWHGNEPCHQIAYLYDFIGKPWKTQRAVRHIMETEYMNAVGGLSGNDDAGQMSAWYIFSALGFYPVCPSTDRYYLGSPLFPRVDIHLENGRIFTIMTENASAENIYVKSVKMNGLKHTLPYITHQDIMKGGTLRFIMTNEHE
ncbi:MAG: GH92 family glycosyl hydrolase [Bacteroidaceae bacterium]|nr:GH92 family glycosyl hydrolase [Bacteroidaceae bacterium]